MKPDTNVEPIYYNRELSRLSFNSRVLQEARDPAVPVLEKLKFLAIFSSNTDEFYRVRVAGIRGVESLKEKTIRKLDYEPRALLKKIKQIINKQQEEVEDIYHNVILPELKANKILLLNEQELDKAQMQAVKEYFNSDVVPRLRPMLVIKNRIAPFLKNNATYLLIKLYPKERRQNTTSSKRRPTYATLEIPTHHLPRFFVLPDRGKKKCVMFLDDLIRFNLKKVFPGYDVIESFAGTLSRDAELYIDDEFSGNIVQKIKRSLNKRRIAMPARFEYDKAMPRKTLDYFVEALSINRSDLLPVRRYHKFRDFFKFPDFEAAHLKYAPVKPLKHPQLRLDTPIIEQLGKKAHLIHAPYQSYEYVLKFLRQAADDPKVVAIKITLYRIAEKSKVIDALIKAAQAGKEVTVFSEVKARFDELPNIVSAEQLESAGANVLYSIPGLKVHAKLCIVTRREGNHLKRYSYLSTGNFNEQTARIYCDIGMFSADQEMAADVNRIFRMLHGVEPESDFKHLLVAPSGMRGRFLELIDFEILQAKTGKRAEIFLKMNSLEDRQLIDKLYEASQAGVKIRAVVRGICCLVPGVNGLSDNIEVISIVDRFLEHARVYWFSHGGKHRMYLASADWMQRNMSRRVEAAFPVLDGDNKKQLRRLMKIQWSDNVKARRINRNQSNPYRGGKGTYRAQSDSYEFMAQLVKGAKS